GGRHRRPCAPADALGAAGALRQRAGDGLALPRTAGASPGERLRPDAGHQDRARAGRVRALPPRHVAAQPRAPGGDGVAPPAPEPVLAHGRDRAAGQADVPPRLVAALHPAAASRRPETGRPASRGVLVSRAGPRRGGGAAGQRFIEAKNSSLDLVVFILSSRNSIAASSSIGCSSLRRIQIFCSSSGSISRSSRRVPDWLTLIAG